MNDSQQRVRDMPTATLVKVFTLGAASTGFGMAVIALITSLIRPDAVSINLGFVHFQGLLAGIALLPILPLIATPIAAVAALIFFVPIMRILR